MTKKIATTAALKLYVGAAVISKAVDSIQRRSAGLLTDIQLAGLSIIAHIDEHSDTTLADRLYGALGKGSRRNSLAQWFITYGKMRVLDKDVPEEAAAIKAGHIFKFDKERTTDMAKAAAKQWHEMIKEPDVKDTFDVHAAYMNLMKRIEQAKKNGLTFEHAEWIEALSAVRAPAALPVA